MIFQPTQLMNFEARVLAQMLPGTLPNFAAACYHGKDHIAPHTDEAKSVGLLLLVNLWARGGFLSLVEVCHLFFGKPQEKRTVVELFLSRPFIYKSLRKHKIFPQPFRKKTHFD